MEQVTRLVGPEVSLVEFGSGHQLKDPDPVFDAFDRPKRYVGVEIAEAFLARRM